MYVVPEELCKVAEACVDLATDLATAVTDAAADLVVSNRDAGNTQGGYDAVAAHGPVVEAAQAAIETLADVFAANADALMLCAFAYSGADEAAATGLEHDPDSIPRPIETPEPQPGPDDPQWPQYSAPEPSPPQPEPGPAPTPSPTPSPTGAR